MRRTGIHRNTVLLVCFLACVMAASAATPTMPNFFARRDYTGIGGDWLQVADTNGDGVPDLIAAGNGVIGVQFGNGDGTFRLGPTTDTIVLLSRWFTAANLTGGATVDVVLTGQMGPPSYPSGIGVSLGKGDGTFQIGTFYQINDDVPYAAVGDFNGDGIPDIAAGGNMGIWLLTGKGHGAFNAPVLAAPLSGASGNIAAADFNGDGKLDLVVTLPGTGFAVLLGNGNGTFGSPRTFTLSGVGRALTVGKLANGQVDIVESTGSGNYVYVYYGNGKGGFASPRTVDLPGGWEGVAIGDVNGDGIPDLVSAGAYIALGKKGGGFESPVSYTVEDAAPSENLVLADLRNNGATDIVVDSSAAVSVLLSLGKGKYEDGRWTAVTGGAGCGAAADFNGDGNPDLAVNNAQGITILLGTGKPNSPFTTGISIALSGAACVITGDLNSDGIPDLLVPMNGTPNGVLAYLGNGDGTFTLASTTPTPNSGGYLALGDFNHDGNLDFATSGNLLALGNGDGTFQTPTPIVPNGPTAGYFSNIAVGDINNDGWPDIVLANGGSTYNDTIYVLLNDQQGGFAQVPSNFGAYTNQAILADLNGDGNLDLVLQSSSGGAYVYLGSGTGAFTSQATLRATTICSGTTVVADVNADGIPDITLLGCNTISIFLGQGGATYAVPFSIGAGPSPGSVLVENLHGQSPSAGIPDIVAPDTSGGVMVLVNNSK